MGDILLILIRKFLKLFKKEHAVLSRYERSHPHFLMYLALDAVVTMAIVFGIFQAVSASSSAPNASLGATVESASDLVKQAASVQADAYWLGTISDDKYTLNTEVPGIADIFYWPSGGVGDDGKNYIYEVKTYKNQKTWDAHTHTILAMANISTIKLKNGTSIRINRSSMKGVIARYTNKAEILAIAYPTPQTLDSMIKDVESLRLVG